MSLTNLHMAMRFKAERGDTPPGRAIADLRLRLMDDSMTPSRRALVLAEAKRLMAIGIGDMPPTTDDLALLIDALAFAIGATSRADAWRSVGIKPRQGDEYMRRLIHTVNWPIWFAIRHGALGE